MAMLKPMTPFDTVLATKRFVLPVTEGDPEEHGRGHRLYHEFDSRGVGKCLIMFLCDDVKITGISLKLELQ